jgi:large subunit ribosomal protein L21
MRAGRVFKRTKSHPALAEGGKGLFAVLETGGKQHKVQPGSVLRVEKLEAAKGDQVTLDRILAVGDDARTVICTPYIGGAQVAAQVLQQGKAKKIIVFKYKAKKNYRRKNGHRQFFTEIMVKAITCPGISAGQADNSAGAGAVPAGEPEDIAGAVE